MIYSTTIQAKTGDLIPLFNSGKPMHSKYNPLNENLAINPDYEGTVIIGGIGSGFHILKALKDSKIARFICFEADEESLSFVKNLPSVKELEKDKRVILTSACNLEKEIVSSYYPALDGDICLISQKAWENENTGCFLEAAESVKKALKTISQDYSVQCHFGRQWQKNIILNLLNFNNKKMEFKIYNADTKKTAAIIAAGPSLERNLQHIIEEREKYYIISTDTAWGTMRRKNIKCDLVVSVDCQHISRQHYMFSKEINKTPPEETFIYDLCSNHNIPDYAAEKKQAFSFIASPHPLALTAVQDSELPVIHSGAGTVTIACCDLADYLGFSKIQIFGADFAYSDGKPYARGTYLEQQFYSASSKLSTAEQKYAGLMYRTELEEKKEEALFSGSLKNAKTNEILRSYEKSMIDWVKSKGYSIKNNILIKEKNTAKLIHKDYVFNADCFLKKLTDTLNKGSLERNELIPFMPFLAWCTKKYPEKTTFENIKLEYLYIKHYNSII